MVWIGRILLVLVGLVLFAVLLLALVVAQINDTLLKPAFYIGVLDENDVYEFVLTDLAAAALEDRRAVEAAQPGDELEDTPLLASGLTTDRIVSGINRALPLAWLQETVEDVVEEFGGYITGRSDDFTLTLRADERVDVVAAEMKALLVEADASRLLYERVLIPRVGEWAESRVREGLPPRRRGDERAFCIRLPGNPPAGVGAAADRRHGRRGDTVLERREGRLHHQRTANRPPRGRGRRDQ